MHVDPISEAILAQLGRLSVRAYDSAKALAGDGFSMRISMAFSAFSSTTLIKSLLTAYLKVRADKYMLNSRNVGLPQGRPKHSQYVRFDGYSAHKE